MPELVAWPEGDPGTAPKGNAGVQDWRGRPPGMESTTSGNAAVRFTSCFRETRQRPDQRPDRAGIRDEWILRAIHTPAFEEIQEGGRIRRWVRIPEAGGRYLRVILLPDGETVHNALLDRSSPP